MSKFSIGQMNQLGDALERAGFTPDDVTKLRSSEGTVRSILELIRGTAHIKPLDPPEFKIFKAIRLGAGPKTAGEFSEALEASGCRVSDWARDILAKPAFKAASKESEANLVVLTVRELGFPKGATYQEICERAQELGLELCPPEVGPQLRLQYPDQPRGEWLIIAMEPITGSDGDLSVFYVLRGSGGLWLRTDDGSPDYHWDADHRFVFLCRK